MAGERPRLPVAIVGAGPVRLSLALGIHVRTREIFRQWGVERRLLDEGVLRQRLALHQAGTRAGRPLVTYDFCDLDGEADTPGVLILEQGRTEALLLEALRETGLCEVRFGAEVTGLAARGDGAPGGEGGSTTRAPAGGRDSWHDPTGSLRSLLDGEDGWILVRPTPTWPGRAGARTGDGWTRLPAAPSAARFRMAPAER